MPLPRASQPDGSGGESEVRALQPPLKTAARRPCVVVVVVVVVVVRTPTPNYLRQASQNLGGSIHYLESILHGYGLRGSSLATDSPSTCFLSRQVYVPYPTTCSSSACFQNGAPRDCESDVSRPRGVGSGFTHWGHRARRRRACCCTAGWRPGCGAVRRPRAT